MSELIAFVIGVVVGSVGWYFIARNNMKKAINILNLDPKAKWIDILAKMREKL